MYTHRKDLWDQIFCSKYQFLASSCYELPKWFIAFMHWNCWLKWLLSYKLKGFGCSGLKLDFFWPGWYLNLAQNLLRTSPHVRVCSSGPVSHIVLHIVLYILLHITFDPIKFEVMLRCRDALGTHVTSDHISIQGLVIQMQDYIGVKWN